MTFASETVFGFVVSRAAHRMRQSLSERFRRAGYEVTHEEWTLLNLLWLRDGQRQGELASGTERDRTTVTRLLDGMVRKHLVARKADAQDRRIVRAWLTARGRRNRDHLVPIAAAFQKECTAGISRKDIAVVLAALSEVQTNLRRDGEHVNPDGSG